MGLLIATLVLLAGVGVVTADQLILNNQKILPNIYVANVPIGGLSKEQARDRINEAARAAAKFPVIVTNQTQIWPVSSDRIGLVIDVDKSVSAALETGRGSSFWQRWRERLAAREQPVNLPVRIKIDRHKLGQVLEVLAKKTDRTSRDASLSVVLKTKSVKLIPAIEGIKLDIEQTVLQATSQSQSKFNVVIDLKFLTQTPKITDEHFVGINSMLSLFSTHFNPWDDNRNANLQLATQRIHGTVLKPGEIFSYNTKVGHRTQQQGFRLAPVILDGKLVPDWGGGICQVSSTLYNSILLADLEVVDRSNHGRAIGYVPLGFDATVVDNLIDFRFKNNLSKPVMLYAEVTDNELTFAVLGNASNNPPPIELDYVVQKVIEPIEIKQPDPTLEIGKEVVEESPQRGFRVATYRIRTIDGKEERQLLAIDDYDPVNKIIKVGTKPNETVPASPVTSPLKKAKPPAGGIPHGTITLQGQIPKPPGGVSSPAAGH